MRVNKRTIVIAWIIVAVLILLFPHYSYKVRSGSIDEGWGFLFSGAFEKGHYANSATPDLGLLVIMEVVVAGIAGAVIYLTKDRK